MSVFTEAQSFFPDCTQQRFDNSYVIYGDNWQMEVWDDGSISLYLPRTLLAYERKLLNTLLKCLYARGFLPQVPFVDSVDGGVTNAERYDNLKYMLYDASKKSRYRLSGLRRGSARSVSTAPPVTRTTADLDDLLEVF